MSQENVERVKAGFAAHNPGDMDALVEFYDPDVCSRRCSSEPTMAARRSG
jgi:hypothetical protein